MYLLDFINNFHSHIFLWLIVCLVVLILEAIVKRHLICLWFSVSAIFALLLALLKIEFWIQFIGFIVVSIFFITINELYFKKQDNKK